MASGSERSDTSWWSRSSSRAPDASDSGASSSFTAPQPFQCASAARSCSGSASGGAIFSAAGVPSARRTRSTRALRPPGAATRSTERSGPAASIACSVSVGSRSSHSAAAPSPYISPSARTRRCGGSKPIRPLFPFRPSSALGVSAPAASTGPVVAAGSASGARSASPGKATLPPRQRAARTAASRSAPAASARAGPSVARTRSEQTPAIRSSSTAASRSADAVSATAKGRAYAASAATGAPPRSRTVRWSASRRARCPSYAALASVRRFSGTRAPSTPYP